MSIMRHNEKADTRSFRLQDMEVVAVIVVQYWWFNGSSTLG